MKIRNIFIGILAVSCMVFSTACGQRDYDDIACGRVSVR